MSILRVLFEPISKQKGNSLPQEDCDNEGSKKDEEAEKKRKKLFKVTKVWIFNKFYLRMNR